MENTSPFSPVVRQTRLSLQVAEQIRCLILQKELHVGDRLPAERDLGEKLHVSRTVIREAIRIMEAKGLLESHGGNGTFVRAIQASDVSDSLEMYLSTQKERILHSDLMEIRYVLEVQIAKLAAERITEDGITRLENALQQMIHWKDDPENFAKYDLEFHLELARATKNHLFEVLSDPFIDALLEGRRLASKLPGISDEAIEHHESILDMMRKHDVKGAESVMKRHLKQSNRVISQALIELQPNTQE
jgi:GntR family transcriptional regulator, transcriptional repressor for pyruvate dehydrogenase complex